MELKEILEKYGINLYKRDGNLKNSIEIIEDLYLKITPHQLVLLFSDIQEEERFTDVFAAQS